MPSTTEWWILVSSATRPSGEPVDDVELPQRPAAVERAAEHALRRSRRAGGRRRAAGSPSRGRGSRGRSRGRRPSRAGRCPAAPRRAASAAAAAGAGARSSSCLTSSAPELSARRRRRVVDAQKRHVAVDPGRFHVQELGVEAGSAAASNDPNRGRRAKKEAMRIAIVGAGISGLATAHLLHREHEITVFEAGALPGGHANTVRVDTEDATHHVDTGFIVFNDRNYPNFERLLAFAGRRVAAVGHELRGLRRRRLRVQRLVAQRAVRQARAPRDAVVSPHDRRPRALQPQRADAAGAPAARGRRSATGSTRAGTRRAFVERLIVPQASAVWSADPRQMWTFPARFLVEFFANHGMLGFAKRPQWRTVDGGSRTYVDAVIRPWRRPAAPRHAGDGDRALRRPRARHAARRRAPSASTRSCSPRTPTRRCGCSPTPPTASTRSSARSRTSPTRRSCTRIARCCRAAGARGRAGTTTCCPSRPG